MRHLLGYILYALAIVITGLVIAAKFFNFGYPPVTPVLMKDPANSLLVALLLSFIARWV